MKEHYYYHPLTIASPDMLPVSIGCLFHGLIRSLANYVFFHHILKLHVFCEAYFFLLVVISNSDKLYRRLVSSIQSNVIATCRHSEINLKSYRPKCYIFA